MRTSQNTNHNNKKIFQKHMQEKLAVTVIVIMLALFALVLVLYDLVQTNGEEYTKIVLSQHSTYDSRVLPYRRGDIVDRNGTKLATSERVYNLIIDPYQIYQNEAKYLAPTVDALAECFGYDKTELMTAISEKKNIQYLRYARRLSQEQKEAFETLKKEKNKAYSDAKSESRINGVWFEDEYRRLYPYNSLACNIIGFSGSDSTQGTGGIEQSYNSSLVGTNGREYGYLNDESNMESVIKSASNGNTIVSTIDVNIQNLVEKRIDQFQTETGSERIGVIVMDPGSGEILAMSTNQRFDLNNPRDLSAYYTAAEIEAMDEKAMSDAWNQMWRNFCVSDTFEPGSPSKVFTVAAGLEEGSFTAGTHFFCDGYQQVATWPIKCTAYSKGGHGDLSVEETLMVSCNDAMMQMAAMEGRELFCKYQRMFGFGDKTGIDLPGEADAKSLVYTADKMDAASLATNSFGQNYNCTMIQMAAAFSSAINGGSYYEPHVAKQILNDQGSVVEKLDPKPVRETVSEATSALLRKSLVRTVDEGTGKAAQVAGYEIGGKTGTAEKYPRGNKKYVVSFCGFAPEENPEVLVYVVIDEPHVEDQAHSSIASAVFAQIMGDILPYMNVFPTRDLPDAPEEIQNQLPVEEGITDNTITTDIPTEGEGETTIPESTGYETDEYVPSDEDGGGLGIPGTPIGEEVVTGPQESPVPETIEATPDPEPDQEPAASAEAP